jgi:hypothetical protein
VTILDARWTVEGVPAVGRQLPEAGLRTNAAVVWVWAPSVDDVDKRLEALAAVHGLPAGVVRSSFVTSAAGGAGVVELWADAGQARAFWTEKRRAAARAALGGAVTLTWFKAPVLLDVAARSAQRAGSRQTSTSFIPDHDVMRAPHDGPTPAAANQDELTASPPPTIEQDASLTGRPDDHRGAR